MPMPAPARPPASPIQPGTSSLNGTTMTNRTTLAQLREMDAAQAARLPVDHLALLLEEVGALKADAKLLADLLHDALHARYGAPAAAARRAEGTFGEPRLDVADQRAERWWHAFEVDPAAGLQPRGIPLIGRAAGAVSGGGSRGRVVGRGELRLQPHQLLVPQAKLLAQDGVAAILLRPAHQPAIGSRIAGQPEDHLGAVAQRVPGIVRQEIDEPADIDLAFGDAEGLAVHILIVGALLHAQAADGGGQRDLTLGDQHGDVERG